jgi:glycosyltransferase involved in cell wall biosynthesis
MPRIRVVHIINSMEVGGAQRQILNLFHAIDRERFDLRLICLIDKGTFGEQLEQEGFPVVALGKSNRIDPGMLVRLVRQLRAWRPDIVHTSVFTSNLWGRLAAILSRVPVRIVHEQSTVSLEKWYRREIDRLLAPWTHRVLAVSEDLRRRIVAEEGIGQDRVEVLYNAVDCRAIQTELHKGTPDGLPGTPGRRVGIVGRIEYRKDHSTLVQAAAQVVREIPDATFLLVGDGPDRDKIAAEIAHYGLVERFVLLGERGDVPRLLGAFDVYALSSITEGLSLSILEAMAAGRPVMATRVGGNSELLDEGACGILVSPGDPVAMAQALIGLLTHPAETQQLGNRARERAESLFDIRAVATRLERIYAKCRPMTP